MINKALLKNEIDQLHEDHLELFYNILRQIPHRASSDTGTHFSASHEQNAMQNSRLIQYQMTEDLSDVTPFSDINDAKVYVRDLRRRRWTRGKRGQVGFISAI